MLTEFKKKLKNNNNTYLRIKVNPGANKTEVKSIMDDKTIKINISEKAEKNKANKALIKFIAKEFQINQNNVKIISGAGQKLKLIKICQIKN